MKKLIVLATLLSASAFAQKISQGAFSELAKFPGLSAAYVQQLPVTINQILNTKAVKDFEKGDRLTLE